MQYSNIRIYLYIRECICDVCVMNQKIYYEVNSKVHETLVIDHGDNPLAAKKIENYATKFRNKQ